jgi:transcriptional regulator with XRE-family HTH domain
MALKPVFRARRPRRPELDGLAASGFNMGHDLRHKTLGWAVLELRTRLEWSQEELATEINRYTSGGERIPTPHRVTISRWESGERTPSPIHSIALAKIAARHEFNDLTEIYRASLDAWELARLVALLRGEDHE